MAEKIDHLHHEFADEDIVAGKTSKSGIVLRPQPTNDPNDPLVMRSYPYQRRGETKRDEVVLMNLL